ncbi:MAG: hypothetical protein AAF467_09100 [Actinomycetota bacterium]
MHDRYDVMVAIQAAWSSATTESPDAWSASNPAKGQCDVSSLVAMEHLGGDIVQGEVHLNGDFQEYHYWNRINGVDLDLTRSQFRRGEVITETGVLAGETVLRRQGQMRAELRDRLTLFRESVAEHLATMAPAFVPLAA